MNLRRAPQTVDELQVGEALHIRRIIKEATEAEYSLTLYKGNCGSYQTNMRSKRPPHELKSY